jgi:hypothetical protein
MLLDALTVLVARKALFRLFLVGSSSLLARCVPLARVFVFLTISRGACAKCVFSLSITVAARLEANRPDLVRVISFGKRAIV